MCVCIYICIYISIYIYRISTGSGAQSFNSIHVCVCASIILNLSAILPPSRNLIPTFWMALRIFHIC